MALYGSQTEYCAIVDNILLQIIGDINHKLRDMKQDIETYNYYFTTFSDGSSEKTIGFQEIDLSCGYLEKSDGTLIKEYERNFAKNIDKPGACDAIRTMYPTHYSKFFDNIKDFKQLLQQNNLYKIDMTITKNNKDRLASSYNSEFYFTDEKLCKDTLKPIMVGENEYETISYCRC